MVDETGDKHKENDSKANILSEVAKGTHEEVHNRPEVVPRVELDEGKKVERARRKIYLVKPHMPVDDDEKKAAEDYHTESMHQRTKAIRGDRGEKGGFMTWLGGHKWIKRIAVTLGLAIPTGVAADVAEGNGLDKTVAVGREAAGITKSAYDVADRAMNYTYEERRDDYIRDLGEESEKKRSEHTVAGDKQSKEIDGKIDFIGCIDGSSLDEKQKNRAIVVVKASRVQISDENKVYSPRLEDMDGFLENPTEELSEDYFYNRIPKQVYDDETKKMIDLTPEEREKRAQLASEVAKSDLGTPLKSFIIVSVLDDPNFSLNKLEKPDTA